jgi:hypothetical protein
MLAIFRLTIASASWGMRGLELLLTSLAICFHQVRDQMAESGSGLSVAVDRATSLGTGPQRAFKPRHHLPGRRSLSSRTQDLSHQAIGALTLALEICPMTGCRRLEPRDLRLQCHDTFRSQGVAWLSTTWSPWRMPHFSEINAHQCLAVIRK